MKIKTDYDGCAYITAGRVYEATECGYSTELVEFESDDVPGGGQVLADLSGECSHLGDGHVWEIVG